MIGFARIYVAFDGKPREARMLQDPILAAVHLGVPLWIRAYVFGTAIGTRVQASS